MAQDYGTTDSQEEKSNEITREDLGKILESKNLTDLYDDGLAHIGKKIVEWFDEDEQSRSEWKEKNNQWLKLATQVIEKKTYPWPGAANVKFPLLTTAAMQFAARAYPALVPGPNLVAGQVIGRDEGGLKQQSAERIGRHMSFQLMHEMEDWEEDMDRLCMLLPIAGCVFKKSYFDPTKGQNVSELVSAQDLVIDYYAKSIETASRKCHIIYRTKNQLEERFRRGIFRRVTLHDPRVSGQPQDVKDQIDGTHEPKITPATPYKLIECHCLWDLDKDGYEEPYIITVDYHTQEVLRIVARFDEESIETEIDEKTGKEKLVAIKPIEYFTKFGFIPNPDGSIYDLGFGLLLGGINESVNTLTNQLLDAGTLNNLQSGFLGRGIRIRSGQTRFLPGEWKPVDFTGDDIKKHIYPVPANEPSEVLLKLLEALVTSGKELASVAEIMVGKMPGQNTPATTTMATIEQGLKVFTAIYKRIYRALGKEYKKLFRLNSLYIDDTVYFTINEPQGPSSQEVSKSDYANKIAVKPNADPNIVSSAQKLMKVQSYGALLQLGTINPLEYTKRYLEAVETENISALINTQPQPDPEQQKMQAELQMKQQEAQMKAQLEQMKAQMDMQKKQMEFQMDSQMKEMELRFKAAELQMKQQEHQMDMMASAQQTQLDMKLSRQEHDQDVEMMGEQGEMKRQENKASHEQKMQQTKEKQTLTAKPSKGGKKK